MSRRLLSLVAVLGALSLAPGVAVAQTTRAAHGFVVDRWGAAEGLPLDHALDVAFTPDGFVWVATVEGLFRFDGREFRPMDDEWIEALGSRRITRLATHPRDGALWIMAEMQSVARLVDGELQVWDELGGPPGRWLVDDQELWLPLDRLYRLDDAPYEVPWAELPLPLHGVASLGDGSLLLSVGEVLYQARPGERPSRFTPADALDGAIQSLVEAADGAPIVDTRRSIYRWDGARFAALDPGGPLACIPIPARTHRFECPPLNQRAGPWRIRNDVITHSGREVWTLGALPEDGLVDSRGDLWVPTQGDGLLRVRPAVLHHLPIARHDARADHLWLDRADRLWVRHASDRSWRTYDPEARRRGGAGVELRDVKATLIRELDEERLIDIGKGVARTGRRAGATIERETGAATTISNPCTAARLPDGVWIIGGGNGLYALDGVEVAPLAVDGEIGRVSALLPLSGGDVAIGTKSRGLRFMDRARRVRPLGRRGGLLVDGIRHLRRDGDTLWVSTEEEGLCAVGPLSGGLEGAAWRCLRPGAARGVHASEVDAAGNTWLSSNVGLWVSRPGELAAFADGGPAPDFLQLGVESGMVKAEANGQSCGTVARDREGVLWFPTQDGVVGADPRRFRFPEAPRASIELARVGERPAAGPLQVEPEQAVELSWVAPAPPEYAAQVRYRVRINDGAWSEPSRGRGITLAGLAPGAFRVEVQAGLAGAWGPIAAIAGHRAPAWHERWLAWVLGLVIAIGVGAGVVRLRTRALRRRQQALEATVAERTVEVRSKADALLRKTRLLSEQSARLAELEGLRSQAIANLHHELRTPLTLVKAGLERLSPPGDPRERENHARVLRNAARLETLMSQLGDIAQLESGELVPRARRLDLRARTSALIGRFQALASQRGITLSPPPPGDALSLWFDPDFFDKILSNLVHNALKFTPPGGAVEISVAPSDELVRVEVSDTGPGIPERARERVFERLFQVEQGADRPHEGSGIGLALARELTELCGGEIGHEPRGGGGTRFWVSLPRGSAHILPDEVAREPDELSPAAPEEPQIVGPDDAPLLLVVEDHADMRAWFVDELSEGFRVATAANGEEGLARALSLRPALVLSDVMMPRLDGLGLARALKRSPDAPPVLLISAKVSAAERQAALDVADGWLPKPFSSTGLRAELRRLTGAELVGSARGSQEVPEVDRQLLERLAAAVDERLDDESLTVPELARAVARSTRTLHRELRRVAGVTPTRWIREHRLRRAMEILRRGEVQTISEVAAAVGMSRAWFTRTYRAWSGRSPGQDLLRTREA
ncbi:MAG: response regulator [Myxococcales bacterium]|nr:response regulator [Myxococcales bacterium]